MTAFPPLIGYRQDRIGARIVCLLNVIRLGRRFGVPAQFVWVSDPKGAWPELTDPADFLDAGFVAEHIRIVPRVQTLRTLRNLSALAPTLDSDQFGRALKDGPPFQCDTAFGALCLMDEAEAEVRAELATIAAELPLSPRLTEERARLRRRLGRHGSGAPAAIHVRRGDLLDGHPWSLTSWPGKFVPDEFFRAWVARQDGPVVAFSDTPAAVRHLAKGQPRIVPIDDLLQGRDLRAAERDVLELLLMGDCARIGAPSNSAFSRAAQLVGQAVVDPLPASLPREALIAAYDALLDRVTGDPGSFLSSGDLAQSLVYATNHALMTGQGGRLVRACAGDQPLMAAHPFTRLLLAQAALSDGRRRMARRLLDAALADPRLQRRDRVQCEQMILLIEADQDGFAPDEALLDQVFRGRNLGGAAVPIFAERALLAGGRASDALLFPPELADALARDLHGGDDPAIRALSGGEGGRVIPPWLYMMDWAELLPDEDARQPLREHPPFYAKLRHIGHDAAEIEALLESGQRPPVPETRLLAERAGLYGAVLTLHGRYRRALQVQSWLLEHCGDDPLVWKRLSNIHFLLGKRHEGMKYLDRALALQRNNPLMQASKARRMAADGRRGGALFHMGRAEEIWPELDLWAQQRMLVMRDLRDHAAATAADNPAAPPDSGG